MLIQNENRNFKRVSQNCLFLVVKVQQSYWGNLHCSCAVKDVRIQYVENYFSYSFDLSVHGEVLVDIRL